MHIVVYPVFVPEHCAASCAKKKVERERGRISSASPRLKAIPKLRIGTLWLRRQGKVPNAFLIYESDELVLAGDLGHDGIVTASAYRNVSNGARGRDAGCGALIGRTHFYRRRFHVAGASCLLLLGALNIDGWVCHRRQGYGRSVTKSTDVSSQRSRRV